MGSDDIEECELGFLLSKVVQVALQLLVEKEVYFDSKCGQRED